MFRRIYTKKKFILLYNIDNFVFVVKKHLVFSKAEKEFLNKK
jgi:hypothetical protein